MEKVAIIYAAYTHVTNYFFDHMCMFCYVLRM